MKNKRILLVITGSVAAYKSLELIRLLKQQGAKVTCITTEGAEQFITPLSCSSLTGSKTYSDLFSLTDESEMGHIRLSRESDLIVVAPASANILAKMAGGFSGDLASTVYLATDKPVLVVPAMNVKMWENASVQRNVSLLKDDGVEFVGPGSGDLACGEEGFGRMAEAGDILVAIDKFFGGKGVFNDEEKPLYGMKALVTSGPTREAIDPVRFISNHSSGKQGHAIAASLAALGAQVSLISGPTTIPDPIGVDIIKVESAKEMFEAVDKLLPLDIAVCAAAVADWRTADVAGQKIKKSGSKKDLTFAFAENPDILVSLSKHTKHRPGLVVGFAAETEHVVENAKVKLEQKGCDWIVANDVSNSQVFYDDENKVHFISKDHQEDWPYLNKTEIGDRLASKVAEYFAKSPRLKAVS